ncbi:MAG: acetyl-CoA carboxylase biotin carboxyl carrier protein [Armatimonadetes bacterium]|nr:acetyl-CoA carboxylase biotin carboxyl carrier protein [Armatimonadota bacterium]
MDSLPLTLEELQRLVTLFEEHRLTELELREGGVRVRLQILERKVAAPPAETVTPAEEAGGPQETMLPPAPAPSREPTPEEKGWIALDAPMTGTFYRSPGPNEPNFIEVGSPVDVDQTVGLIEAMKIFSEIHSEIAGTVMEIPAQSGQMVQPGQTLVWIQPS